jgi:hypothetical protein
MHDKYHAIYLSLLAVLGLESGCSTRVGDSQGSAGESQAESATGMSESADGETSTSVTSGGTPDMPDEPPEPFSCENPVELLQPGTELPSGWVYCNGGFIHRAEAVECVMAQADDDPICVIGGDGDGDGDGDAGSTECGNCDEQPYGSCQQFYTADGGGCQCVYGCATDADCGPNEACVCAGVLSFMSQCVPADCLTDADCGEGLCSLSHVVDYCGAPYDSLHCAGPLDECHGDDECGIGPCPGHEDEAPVGYYCAWEEGEGFTCQARGDCYTACGRPFFVDARARIAGASTRGDWSCAARPRPVDAATSARLAAYWTEIGLFEHASIASFARMCLALMQLGAPPSLLLATRAALGDEIEHARLTFGLASAYAGREIGPGAIDVVGSLDGLELHAIVQDLVREACVEETLAAIEAGEAASRAEDPCVAAILEQIAGDELRHARLGWLTLQWILKAYPEIQGFAFERLATAIAKAREAALAPADAGSSETLHHHGVLDDAMRQRVRRAAIAAVLEPCALRWRLTQPIDPRADPGELGF